jgi:hypothetical protein
MLPSNNKESRLSFRNNNNNNNNNNNVHISGVSCNVAKTFYCINHKMLLSKLNFYGILGIAGQRFKSYWHNRKQQVEIKSANSNYKTYPEWDVIKHEVCQGSIFGPLLFLIHINDQPATINLQS